MDVRICETDFIVTSEDSEFGLGTNNV